MSMNSKHYVTITWLKFLHIDIIIPNRHIGSDIITTIYSPNTTTLITPLLHVGLAPSWLRYASLLAEPSYRHRLLWANPKVCGETRNGLLPSATWGTTTLVRSAILTNCVASVEAPLSYAKCFLLDLSPASFFIQLCGLAWEVIPSKFCTVLAGALEESRPFHHES